MTDHRPVDLRPPRGVYPLHDLIQTGLAHALGSDAIAVHQCLWVFAQAHEECRPSVAKVAHLTGMNRHTVSKALDKLVGVCQRRGYHPVLLEMPRDMAVIGHAFDAATGQYQAGARQLARKYGIPYVDFIDKAHFVDSDFYDVDHLVEPGRPKFQSLLAAETSRRLALYGMLPPAKALAAPAPATLASGIDPHVAWPVGMAAVVLVGAFAVRRNSALGLPRYRR